MIGKRIGATLFGVSLALGGVAVTAAAAGAQSQPETSTTEQSLPSTGGPVTVNVPGVGTVSFTVDPATGAITDLVITPLEGVTVGDPVITTEGVKVQVTLADGTVNVLEIQAKADDNGFEVEVEVETDEHEAGDDNGTDTSGEHGGGVNSGPGNTNEDHSGPSAGSGGSSGTSGSGEHESGGSGGSDGSGEQHNSGGNSGSGGDD